MANTKTNIATAEATQDKNAPVNGTKVAMPTKEMVLRSPDRSPKDRGSLRAAHLAAESVFYPNSTRLFDIYEDVLLDLYLAGIIKKRISQVVNKKLLLLNSAGEPVPGMKKFIKSKVFKDLMRQILWTKMWGINGIEFIPGAKMSYNLIAKKHIKRKTQKLTYEQYGLDEGIDYTQLQNVWVMGDPGDLGLLLVCGYIVMLKKGAISDWAQYIELFGSPAIILKYKGYDTSAKVAADKILQNIGNSMRITIPEEMMLTFEDGKVANGDGKLHNTFRQACNEELAVTILGNTETTSNGANGSQAKSKTHSEQQLEIIRDDMDDVCDALNSDQFMRILQSYGYNTDGWEFCFDAEIDISFLTDKIAIDEKLAKMGLPIPFKYLYETYGIPEPKEGEKVLVFVSKTTDNPQDFEEVEEVGKTPKTTKRQPKLKQPVAALPGIDVNSLAAQVVAMLKQDDFFA